MSILKAYKIKNKNIVELNYEGLKNDFRLAMEELLDDGVAEQGVDKKEVLYHLNIIYSLYAVKYLMNVGDYLTESQLNKDTMSYMNSIIVELTYDCGLKYYEKTMSYGIVDKMVQKALDLALNDDMSIDDISSTLYHYCVTTLYEIEESHKEEITHEVEATLGDL